MADKTNKNAKNVAGKYYVDTNCISCGQCCDICADCFAEDGNSGLYYVAKQPGTPEMVSLFDQVISSCPVEAVGNDGE